MIINIRGSSGSGKSTLVHRFLAEHSHVTVEQQLSDWKKPKIVGYWVKPDERFHKGTFIVGSYKTQCGGCDSMSYKGSHSDIEKLIRAFMEEGNVIYEGLTISSTISRWLRISQENPGEFIWAFMDTPEEICYERIMARNGGREPKRDSKGLADYQRKYRGCMRQRDDLIAQGEQIINLSSDDSGYKLLLDCLQ